MRKLRRTVLAATAGLLAATFLVAAPAPEDSAAGLAGPYANQGQCRIYQADHASNGMVLVGSCFKLGYSWYYSYR